jgi:hypothetical protein
MQTFPQTRTRNPKIRIDGRSLINKHKILALKKPIPAHTPHLPEEKERETQRFVQTQNLFFETKQKKMSPSPATEIDLAAC